MDTDLLLDAPAGTQKRRFLLHVLEMMVVMMIGMCALGGVSRGFYALIAGHGFVLRQHVVLAAFVMAVDMTLPMALWMRFRGHSWERAGEMGLAMFAPTLVALAFFWAGALAWDAVLGIAMILMIPAMVGVMLYRKDEYGAPHGHGHRGRRRLSTSVRSS